MKKGLEFGGVAAAQYIRKCTGGRRFAVVAVRVLGDHMESDGIVGHARSWTGAVRLLHDRGFRLLRVGGSVDVYRGEELGYPEEAWVVCVTVVG